MRLRVHEPGARCSALVITIFLFLATPVRAAVSRPAHTMSAEPFSFATEKAEGWSIDHILKQPIQNRIGQLIMVGFSGTHVSETLAKTLSSVRPGAVVVFQRNVKSARQTSELLFAAQRIALSTSKTPLLIAVDQEGGNVVRIRSGPPLPSALSYGLLDNEALTLSAGRGIGKTLKVLGFNMNLAPVVDISDQKSASFIGTRSFGGSPPLVSRLASAFGRGLQEAGILPTAKHFPGHGSLEADSHLESVSNWSDRTELLEKEFKPYLALQDQLKLPWAVMLGHVAFPRLDPTRTPATFSKEIVQTILRGELRFRGLVITDDLDMGGADSIGDLGERAVKSIEAGADMVMLSWGHNRQVQVVNALLKAVKSGRLSEERIDHSIRRILSFKREYIKNPSRPFTEKEILAGLRNSDLQTVARDTVVLNMQKSLREWLRAQTQPNVDAAVGPHSVQSSVTLVDAESRAPASAFLAPTADLSGGKPVLVFSTNRRFLDSFSMAKMKVRTLFGEVNVNGAEEINRSMRRNPSSVGVFYISGKRMGEVTRRIDPAVAARLLLVNAEARGNISNPERFKHIVEIGYRHPSIGRLTAESFFRPGSPASGLNPSDRLESPSRSNPIDSKAPRRSLGAPQMHRPRQNTRAGSSPAGLFVLQDRAFDKK